MTRGDLYWVDFPGGAGRAQAGRRPAIVVQGDQALAKLPTVLVVPCTTQQDALRFPGTVLVEPDASNGLRQPSVALVFQLTSLDKRFLGSRIGSLSAAKLTAIWEALDEVMERH